MDKPSDYQIATFKNASQVFADLNGFVSVDFFNDTFVINSSRQILVKGFYATFEYLSLTHTIIPVQYSKQKNGLNYSLCCRINFFGLRLGVFPNPFMTNHVPKLSNDFLILSDGVFLPEQFYVNNNGSMELGGLVSIDSLAPNAQYHIQVEFAIYYCEL